MSRSRSALGATWIILVLIVAACGSSGQTGLPTASSNSTASPNPTSESGPSETVTISFWHTYNEKSAENETLVNQLIPQFESAHPGIKVESLTVTWEDFRRKLTSAIAGGVAPDVIRSDIAWVPEYADMGAFLALDQEMADFAQLKDSFYPGPLSTNLWNGHYYGLPLDTNTKVWLYNPSLYAAAGAGSAPTSLNALEGICANLKEAKPDTYLFGTDGTFTWVTLPWIWSSGGEITDTAITTATGYTNGPKTVAAYEYLLRLYDQGCIAPVILGDGVDQFLGFGQGLYASLDNGPWTYPIVAGQHPEFEFSSALFPAGAAGSIDVVGGEDVNVLTQSAHKAEALEFVRFLVDSDFQLGMGEVGQIPARSDLDVSALLAAHPELDIFLEQLKTSRARPAHPQWSNMDQVLTDAGQLILRHELSPQAALDGAAAEIDALLAQ